MDGETGVRTFSCVFVSRRLAYQAGKNGGARCKSLQVEICASAAGLPKWRDSLQRNTSVSRDSSDGPRGIDSRRGSDSRPGPGSCPSGGRVQAGHDLPPSSRRKTALHHGEVQPIEPLHRAASSSILHATYSGGRRDTNSRLPTRSPGQG